MQKLSMDEMNGLERDVTLKSDNFIVSKAITIDNRPEKA